MGVMCRRLLQGRYPTAGVGKVLTHPAKSPNPEDYGERPDDRTIADYPARPAMTGDPVVLQLLEKSVQWDMTITHRLLASV
jgi:hypothetical protein